MKVQARRHERAKSESVEQREQASSEITRYQQQSIRMDERTRTRPEIERSFVAPLATTSAGSSCTTESREDVAINDASPSR